MNAAKIVDWARAAGQPGFRAGQWVEVRSKEEILATLGADGTLDGLPFMPQMFSQCGKRFQVFRRAHKTCDTVNRTGGRRLSRTVHLQDFRCDGQAYGGCDNDCLIFWKEAWLKKVSGPAEGKPHERGPLSARGASIEAAVWANTRAPGSTEADPTYRCQATELPKFTQPLKWYDVRQYVEDWTSGNVPAQDLLVGAAYVAFHDVALRVGRRLGIREELVDLYDKFQKLRGGVPFPRKRGAIPVGDRTPLIKIGLKPGASVKVKSYEQILSTLDGNNKNRGLFFDAEEVPYCEKSFKVRSRVNRIVDERTGKMIDMKGQAVILEGVYCMGHYSNKRMHCPRAIHPFWREGWLEAQDAETTTDIPASLRYSEVPRGANAHSQSTFPPPAPLPEQAAHAEHQLRLPPGFGAEGSLKAPPPFKRKLTE